jgi:uncharacterized membrane protein YdjX (TVP38/TMEM64 family)
MINTKRMILAFLVALLAVNVYGLVVFGWALGKFHAEHQKWLRPAEQVPVLRAVLSSALHAALVTLFYALFARGNASRLSTGLVFGVLLGFIAGWIPEARAKLLFVDYPF